VPARSSQPCNRARVKGVIDPRTAQITNPEQPLADRKPEEALTRRERQIAELVVGGLTNRQIAEELVISEHTVATHVRRILKKLGLQSRTQIAFRLEDQSPLP